MPRHYHKDEFGYAAGIGHDSSEGMMSSSHSSMANCPTEVIMKAYPKAHSYLPEDLDDSIRGVDDQMGGDERQLHRGLKPRKA